MTANEAMSKAIAIAGACKIGEISYTEAKKLCEPFLKIANDRISEIAKKHGKKPYKVTFTGILR